MARVGRFWKIESGTNICNTLRLLYYVLDTSLQDVKTKLAQGIYKRGNTFWYRIQENGKRRAISLTTDDASIAITRAALAKANAPVFKASPVLCLHGIGYRDAITVKLAAVEVGIFAGGEHAGGYAACSYVSDFAVTPCLNLWRALYRAVYHCKEGFALREQVLCCFLLHVPKGLTLQSVTD